MKKRKTTVEPEEPAPRLRTMIAKGRGRPATVEDVEDESDLSTDGSADPSDEEEWDPDGPSECTF